MAAVTVLTLALPGGPGRAVLMLVLNGVTVAAIVLGLRRYRPAARSAWLVLLVTQLLSVAAFTSWYLIPTLTGEALPVPSPADGLFLALYAGNCLAVGLLVRRERSARDRQTLVDVLIVTVSLAALSWVFLMAPYVRAAELSAGVKVVSLAYPLVDLVLVVLVLRLAVSGSRTTPAKALLLACCLLPAGGRRRLRRAVAVGRLAPRQPGAAGLDGGLPLPRRRRAPPVDGRAVCSRRA